MNLEDPFSRGQMEWALWQSMSHHNGNAPQRASIPPIFLYRIKRLIEFDAQQAAEVFGTSPRVGRGAVATYTRFHVFLMRLALVLLDSGFKQGDVIFLLKHIKSRLEQQYSRILKSHRHNPRDVCGTDTFPDRPQRFDNPRLADMSVFMLIKKNEILECLNNMEGRTDPLIFQPEFYYGRLHLMKEMSLAFREPSAMLIELDGISVSINTWLSEAPVKRRGRKREDNSDKSSHGNTHETVAE
jgi:hypothetical protein